MRRQWQISALPKKAEELLAHVPSALGLMSTHQSLFCWRFILFLEPER
jgi:hypothetical protein